MKTIRLGIAAALAGVLAAPMARADEMITAGKDYTAATWPVSVVSRPLTLGTGMIELQLPVNISLSNGAVGKPVGIAPSIYYGVNQNLTVGITHDFAHLSSPLSGICAGDSAACPSNYSNLGVEALYNLMPTGPFQAAGVVGVDFPRFSPNVAFGAYVGADARYGMDAFALVFRPRVYFGITQRDFGNKEAFAIPAALQFQATPELEVELTSGINGPFSGFSDAFAVPVGLGATYAINSTVDLGGRFQLANLHGINGAGAADARVASIFANVRF